MPEIAFGVDVGQAHARSGKRLSASQTARKAGLWVSHRLGGLGTIQIANRVAVLVGAELIVEVALDGVQSSSRHSQRSATLSPRQALSAE